MSGRRFNLLMLEEGEHLLEECAAALFTWAPDGGALRSEAQLPGRLRVCTRSVCFEPDDAREPIVKYSLRGMPGKPMPLASSAATNAPGVLAAVTRVIQDAGFHPREALALQPGSATEIKASGRIGPYTTRVFEAQKVAESAATAPAAELAPTRARGFFGSKVAVTSRADATTPTGPDGQHTVTRHLLCFVLMHTSAASLVPLLDRLWVLQAAAAGAHSGYERAALEPILAPRREGPFDLSLLGDFRERPLTPAAPRAIAVERIYPLVTVPGRLLLTERALYIAPVALNNIAGADAVTKWPLRDVSRVLRRRRLLRETGLELQLSEDAPSVSSAAASSAAAAAGLRPSATGPGGLPSSVFLSFADEGARDEVYRLLLAQLRQIRAGSGGAGNRGARSGFSAPPSDAAKAASPLFDNVLGDPFPDALRRLTTAWQMRSISTLDYLLALNSAAGRTVADLTQYPVMPWVISDYESPTLDLEAPETFRDLSKPIGALNEKRLSNVRSRFRDMPPDDPELGAPFMWGTHYSAPGYCLHFLVRAMPEHMLHLQAGRFDAPDRAFASVAGSWAGVTSTNMDVKELIPEFYASDGAFLLAPPALDLGVRQNGRRVGDVTLPRWAADAGDFVAQCRAALESDWVSARIHHWIDLIFGYKQRGPAAVAADNVFYYMTYEGAVDASALADPDRRAALQSQIAEFGQTPRQLWDTPHESRFAPPSPQRPPAASEVVDDEPHAEADSAAYVGAITPASSATLEPFERAQPAIGDDEVTVPTANASPRGTMPRGVGLAETDAGVERAAGVTTKGSRRSTVDHVDVDPVAVVVAKGSRRSTVDVDDVEMLLQSRDPSAGAPTLAWSAITMGADSVVDLDAHVNGTASLNSGSASQGSVTSKRYTSLLMSPAGTYGDGVTGLFVSGHLRSPGAASSLQQAPRRPWEVAVVAALADGCVLATNLAVSVTARRSDTPAASGNEPTGLVGDSNDKSNRSITAEASSGRAPVILHLSPVPVGGAVFSSLLHTAVVTRLVAADAMRASVALANVPQPSHSPPVSAGSIALTALSCLRDGRIALASCQDGRTFLLDVTQGAVIAVLENDHPYPCAEDAAIESSSPPTRTSPRSPACSVALAELGVSETDTRVVALVGYWDGSLLATPLSLRHAASGAIAATLGTPLCLVEPRGVQVASAICSIASAIVNLPPHRQGSKGTDELWIAAGSADGALTHVRLTAAGVELPQLSFCAPPAQCRTLLRSNYTPLPDAYLARGALRSGVVAVCWLRPPQQGTTTATTSRLQNSPLPLLCAVSSPDGALHLLSASTDGAPLVERACLATGRPLRCADVLSGAWISDTTATTSRPSAPKLPTAQECVVVTGDQSGGIILWDCRSMLRIATAEAVASADAAVGDVGAGAQLMPATTGKPFYLTLAEDGGVSQPRGGVISIAVLHHTRGAAAVIAAGYGTGELHMWAGTRS